MSAMLEVRATAAYASIQDAGRFGYRRIGVPWSGVLDPALMRIANRLVGNPENHPVIECFDGGQAFVAISAPLRVAVAGHASLHVIAATGSARKLAAWRSAVLEPGDTLRLGTISPNRVAIVAVAGLEAPTALDSCASYARASLCGGALSPGNRLAASDAAGGTDALLPNPPEPAPVVCRVMLGPQQDRFETASIETFLNSEYHISAAADRMGIRLDGPALRHRRACGHEIISDATIPGAIQVPGDGRPIVLLADAQTAGGYPKIATIITADLAGLATRRIGAPIRFKAVEAAEGEELARAAEREIRTRLGRIRPLAPASPDLDALYSVNLVDGAVDALASEPSQVHAAKDRTNGN